MESWVSRFDRGSVADLPCQVSGFQPFLKGLFMAKSLSACMCKNVYQVVSTVRQEIAFDFCVAVDFLLFGRSDKPRCSLRYG